MEVMCMQVQYLYTFASISNSTPDWIIPADPSCMEVHRGHGSTAKSPLSLPKFHIFSWSCRGCVYVLHISLHAGAHPSPSLIFMNLTGAKQYGGNLSPPLGHCSCPPLGPKKLPAAAGFAVKDRFLGKHI